MTKDQGKTGRGLDDSILWLNFTAWEKRETKTRIHIQSINQDSIYKYVRL